MVICCSVAKANLLSFDTTGSEYQRMRFDKNFKINQENTKNDEPEGKLQRKVGDDSMQKAKGARITFRTCMARRRIC